MRHLRGKGILWFFGAVCVFVIFSAVRIGAADFFSSYARKEMHAWSLASTPPDGSSVQNVSRALNVTWFLSPDNPDVYEDKARLSLMRAGIAGISDAEKNARIEEGLANIRQAIISRPISPYSWAILLLLKRELFEYDAEFRLALERAVTLGPWEPGVQPVVADVGLSAWNALPKAEQEMVRKNFVRGMKRQAEVMWGIVQSHGDDCHGAPFQLNAACPK